MFDLNRVFSVISAQKSDLNESENNCRHEQLGYFLRQNGYEVVEVKGVYKDTPEKGYFVHGSPNKNGWSMKELLDMLASSYGQDSYILCDGAGSAFLFNRAGENSSSYSVKKLVDRVRRAIPSDVSYTEFPNGERYTLYSTI